MQSIGDVIKARRTALGMTADELAHKLNKSRATIYRYESTDVENMPVGVLEPLARALNTTPIELMGWASRQVDYESKDIEEQIPAAGVPYFRKLRHQWEVEKVQEIDHNLAANLKTLLNPLEISAFVEKTGINDQERIGSILKGIPSELSNDEFDKICEFFNIPPEKLLYTNLDNESKKASAFDWATSPDDNYEYEAAATKIKKEIDFQDSVRGFSPSIYDGCLKVLQHSHFNDVIGEAFTDYIEQMQLVNKELKKRIKNPIVRFSYRNVWYKNVAELIISNPEYFWKTYLMKDSGAFELARATIQRSPKN
ncbi:helix-turn-helix transcriptional regulator [Selenomonas sp. WCA-380-WT-3B 3/]|uniref:Helix-turn-helix transcriptional regulator n=1 Tax=Selenomonas montiformis TaxID=2652285 RepID=A0A6I2V3E2_9FIRM|nr:helix-turn-helix transcriptional regulator [Selenomonas montiformis]MSV25982.1 helix-turn-helix transcriptional regulator [Selenomonas montiformis]